MELHFTPEQEAQLAQAAQHAGKPVEHCLTDAAMAVCCTNQNFCLAFVDEALRRLIEANLWKTTKYGAGWISIRAPDAYPLDTACT